MEDRAVVCIRCNGSGWKAIEGSLQARPCECQGEQRRRNRTTAAAIPKRYDHCRLSTFNERGNPSATTAKERVSDFVATWPQEERGLLLMGSCGVGKTHLAVSVLHHFIDLDVAGKLLFCNFQDLVQELHASFSSDEAPSKSEIVKPILDADLLVLDELGSQKPTAFVQDMLYYIINTRYNDVKTTIFTTNYFDEPARAGDEKLEQRIGERLRSRLHEMTDGRIIIQGQDYRTRRTSGKTI